MVFHRGYFKVSSHFLVGLLISVKGIFSYVLECYRQFPMSLNSQF